ncbi:MAG: hypothetical protein AAFW83_07640 [Pseudomonadota bacterium]
MSEQLKHVLKTWRRIPAIIRQDKALLLSLGALFALAPFVINRVMYPVPDTSRMATLQSLAQSPRQPAQAASVGRLKSAYPAALIVTLPARETMARDAVVAHLSGQPVFVVDQLGRAKKLLTGRDRDGSKLNLGAEVSSLDQLIDDICTDEIMIEANQTASGVPNGSAEICQFKDLFRPSGA